MEFGPTQLILIALLLGGAGFSVFLAKRSQRPLFIHVAILLLGFVLVVAFNNIWLGICILFLAAGGCMAYHGQCTKSFQKTIAGIVMLVVGLISFIVVRISLEPDPEEELSAKRLQYDLAQYETLGKMAMAKYSGQNVAVIVPPDMTEQQKKMLEAFEKGFGASVKVVQEKQFDPQAFREANVNMQEDKYQKKLETEMAKFSLKTLLLSPEMAKVNVVLMMTALPAKKTECLSFLEEAKKKKKVLLIPADSAKRASVWLEPYISNKHGHAPVGMLVLKNSDFNIQEDVPEKTEDAFKACYVLVTSDNIDNVANDPQYKVMLVEDSPEN